MHHSIENLRHVRIHLLKLIENLSTEELNRVPAGFNNNVNWNLGHMLASQQSICYSRSGLHPTIDENYFTLYQKGTKPTDPVSETDIQVLKNLFLQTIDQFGKDYDEGLFNANPFKAWTTAYGNEILNTEDAISFDMFHEGLHRGYIMALKRVI